MAVWTTANARAAMVGPGGSLRTASRASSFQTSDQAVGCRPGHLPLRGHGQGTDREGRDQAQDHQELARHRCPTFRTAV